MSVMLWLASAIGLGVVSLGFALYLYAWVNRQDAGGERDQQRGELQAVSHLGDDEGEGEQQQCPATADLGQVDGQDVAEHAAGDERATQLPGHVAHGRQEVASVAEGCLGDRGHEGEEQDHDEVGDDHQAERGACHGAARAELVVERYDDGGCLGDHDEGEQERDDERGDGGEWPEEGTPGPADEQRDRMRGMRSYLAEFNVYRWAGRMLVDAARLRKRGSGGVRVSDALARLSEPTK